MFSLESPENVGASFWLLLHNDTRSLQNYELCFLFVFVFVFVVCFFFYSQNTQIIIPNQYKNHNLKFWLTLHPKCWNSTFKDHADIRISQPCFLSSFLSKQQNKRHYLTILTNFTTSLLHSQREQCFIWCWGMNGLYDTRKCINL